MTSSASPPSGNKPAAASDSKTADCFADCLAECPVLRPLVNYLRSLSGPADIEVLAAVMRGLEITRDDVERWCSFSQKGYHRAMIAQNQHFDLLLISWQPGQRSAIHDHAGSACAFRVLEGTGVENTYRCIDKAAKRVEGPLYTRRMKTDSVCASTHGDIHEVVNPEPRDTNPGSNLVTLHCYTPPLKMTAYTLDR